LDKLQGDLNFILELRLLLFVLGVGIALYQAKTGQAKKDDQNGPGRFPHSRIIPPLILGLADRKVKNRRPGLLSENAE
jgi:hypothetical protein